MLDVGCGCGGSTLEIAEAVGARGRVVAVDFSAPMLTRARERAARLAERIEWREQDAQTADLGTGRFDLVFSRFGVMFFADPVAAFANLHRALRPGGRLTFVCWQPREKNPWMLLPTLAAARHAAFPPPPPPDAPGPFAFGDAARVRSVLGDAGFGAIAIEALEEPLRLPIANVEEGVEFFLTIGPVGGALREAKATDAQRARVAEALGETIESFRTPRGFEAPAAAWIVSAKAAS